MHTNTVNTLSTIMTWHSQTSLERYTYLGRFLGTLPWKMKVIHGVLSSSDVGRKWRLELGRHRASIGLLMRHCWRYSCSIVEKMEDRVTIAAVLNSSPRAPPLCIFRMLLLSLQTFVLFERKCPAKWTSQDIPLWFQFEANVYIPFKVH